MHILDSFLTLLVFVPFSVLVLFYFLSIMRGTLRDREKLNSWRDAAKLGGIVLLQIGGVGFAGLFLYLIFFGGAGF